MAATLGTRAVKWTALGCRMGVNLSETMDQPGPMSHPLVNLVSVVDRWIERLERFVLATGIMAMAAVNIANALGRTLLGHSLTFTEEVNQILLVVITFMGIGYAARLGRHIRMSALYDQLHGGLRKTLQVLTLLGTAALLGLLAYYAVVFVDQKMSFGGTTPALGIPWYIVYMVVPLGFALGAIQFLLGVIRNLTAPGVHVSLAHEETYDEAQPPAAM